jgi:hypothetical protein
MSMSKCNKCKVEFFYDIDLGINVQAKTLTGRVLPAMRKVWPVCPRCNALCWSEQARKDNTINLLLEELNK